MARCEGRSPDRKCLERLMAAKASADALRIEKSINDELGNEFQKPKRTVRLGSVSSGNRKLVTNNRIESLVERAGENPSPDF